MKFYCLLNSLTSYFMKGRSDFLRLLQAYREMNKQLTCFEVCVTLRRAVDQSSVRFLVAPQDVCCVLKTSLLFSQTSLSYIQNLSSCLTVNTVCVLEKDKSSIFYGEVIGLFFVRRNNLQSISNCRRLLFYLYSSLFAG